MHYLNRAVHITFRSAAAMATLILCAATVKAGEAKPQLVAVRPDGTPNTILERDVFAMGGDDLNHWPYIEHSSSNGDIQGINFMVPDNSRWGWRFISRITDTNVTVRAAIDVAGNASFNGIATAQKVVSNTTLQTNGTLISAGKGAPSAPCAVGDLYMRKDGASGSTVYSCGPGSVWSAVGASTATSTPLFAASPFTVRSIVSAANSTALATVKTTLGLSTMPHKSWYVCSIIEATTQTDDGASGRIVFGIAADAGRGTSTPIRTYSRPENSARDPHFADNVLSDWPAIENASSSGRYCNTYESGATLAFTAYAVPLALHGVAKTVYTSGQIEIQAYPQ